MQSLDKILDIGTIASDTRRRHRIFCHVVFADGKLSISGVIDPRISGNCGGSCGQIDMEFAHANPKDDDSRYGDRLIKAGDIIFSDGWTREKWYRFLSVWKVWHLNDMQAGCEHQRALEWGNEHIGDACAECGYEYGSAWLKREVPRHVLMFLADLPDSKRTPAWI